MHPIKLLAKVTAKGVNIDGCVKGGVIADNSAICANDVAAALAFGNASPETTLALLTKYCDDVAARCNLLRLVRQWVTTATLGVESAPTAREISLASYLVLSCYLSREHFSLRYRAAFCGMTRWRYTKLFDATVTDSVMRLVTLEDNGLAALANQFRSAA